MTPLEEGQGCIAEPKYIWVGIYWLSATLLYTVSVSSAIVFNGETSKLMILSRPACFGRREVNPFLQGEAQQHLEAHAS